MVPFCSVPFCPRVPFCPNIPCSILPPSLRLEKRHYVNYNITRCSIKWFENANNRYMIIFNHMQWFYYLICQNTWCQKVSKLIYQKGEFRFCEILKTWSFASLISMQDAELAHDRNQVDMKIDPRLAWFFQNIRCSILSPCSILPRLTITLEVVILKCISRTDILSISLKLSLSREYNNTALVISQHWLRYCLDPVRQQAISWANVGPDLRRHMVSVGHDELTLIRRVSLRIFLTPPMYRVTWGKTPIEVKRPTRFSRIWRNKRNFR